MVRLKADTTYDFNEVQPLARKSSPRSSTLSRREFGQRVALVTTAAGIAASARAADARAQDDRAVEKLSVEGRVRFESMWQNVLRKHGGRLTDEQKTRMRKIIANNVAMLESVYAVALNNGDAPATTLLLVEPAGGKR